jgi:CxxC-x17-CxxC domain-containing protein
MLSRLGLSGYEPVETGAISPEHHDAPLTDFARQSRELRHEKECFSLQTDRTLTCADCGQEFVFTASEQQLYTDRGFSDPRRCRNCRAARKAQMGSGDSMGGGYSAGGAGGFRERRPREMFEATCSNCGKTAMVPFRPTSGKPVFCDDCFSRRRA